MASDTVSSGSYTYKVRPATYSDLPFLPDVEASAATLFLSDPSLAPLALDQPMSAERHENVLHKWAALGVGEGGTYVAVGIWMAESLDEAKAEAQSQQEGVKEAIVGFIVTELIPVERRQSIGQLSMDPNEFGTASSRLEGASQCNGRGTDATEKESNIVVDVDDTGAELYFLHINELSIHALHQRKGLASKLIGAVQACAQRLSVRTSTPKASLRIIGLSLTTMRDVPYNAPFYSRFGFHEIPEGGTGGIGHAVGEKGLQIWKDDQDHFEAVGNGMLKSRRCWMVCDVVSV